MNQEEMIKELKDKGIVDEKILAEADKAEHELKELHKEFVEEVKRVTENYFKKARNMEMPIELVAANCMGFLSEFSTHMTEGCLETLLSVIAERGHREMLRGGG